MNRNQLIAHGIQAAFNGLVIWSIGTIGTTLASAITVGMGMFIPNIHAAYDTTGVVLYGIAMAAVFIGSLGLTALSIKRMIII